MKCGGTPCAVLPPAEYNDAWWYACLVRSTRQEAVYIRQTLTCTRRHLRSAITCRTHAVQGVGVCGHPSWRRLAHLKAAGAAGPHRGDAIVPHMAIAWLPLGLQGLENTLVGGIHHTRVSTRPMMPALRLRLEPCWIHRLGRPQRPAGDPIRAPWGAVARARRAPRAVQPRP